MTQDRQDSGTLRTEWGLGTDRIDQRAFELRTVAADRVSRIIARSRTAAIGIGGQRGSGKTTLITNFAAPPSRSVESSAGRVVVSAPVQYEARDFLLHVFAEVCQSIVGRELFARPQPGNRTPVVRPYVAVAYHLWNLVVRIVICGCGLVAGYLAFRILADRGLVAPLVALAGVQLPSGGWEGSLLRQVAFLAAGAWILFNLGAFARSVRRRSSFLAAMFGRFRAPDYPLWIATAVVAATGAGIVLLWVSLRVRLPDTSLLVGLGLIVSILVTVSAGRLADRQPLAPTSPSQYGDAERGLRPRRSESLSELARFFLAEIRFQQSFTTGWGGKISMSSPIAGGEISRTTGVTMARTSWTLPETVANLRDLLARTGREYGRVILAVDEVDKIEDPHAARRFVDDLKAIFQIDRCFFLVSVSDDALASFERRGLPFRDSFDSAFNEVVSLDSGGLEDSVTILGAHVVGTPAPFVCLCHVISGGLPRDLIRVAEELYDLPQPVEFAVAAARLVEKNLLSKFDFVIRAAAGSNSATVVDLISWAETADHPVTSIAGLVERLDDLAAVIANVAADETHQDEQEKRAILRSCYECEAILLLAVTIVEFAERIQAPSVERAQVDSLASLASIKKLIALQPTAATVRLQRFRHDHGLAPLSSRDTRPDGLLSGG